MAYLCDHSVVKGDDIVANPDTSVQYGEDTISHLQTTKRSVS